MAGQLRLYRLCDSLVDHLQELVHGEVFATVLSTALNYEVDDASAVTVDRQDRDVVAGRVDHLTFHTIPPGFYFSTKKA